MFDCFTIGLGSARKRGKTLTLGLQGEKFWIKVLRIVCQVDALIAKVAANLENAVEATNDKPGLYGDTGIYFWGAGPRVKRNAKRNAMPTALPEEWEATFRFCHRSQFLVSEVF